MANFDGIVVQLFHPYADAVVQAVLLGLAAASVLLLVGDHATLLFTQASVRAPVRESLVLKKPIAWNRVHPPYLEHVDAAQIRSAISALGRSAFGVREQKGT
jgi:hypothetical protein